MAPGGTGGSVTIGCAVGGRGLAMATAARGPCVAGANFGARAAWRTVDKREPGVALPATALDAVDCHQALCSILHPTPTPAATPAATAAAASVLLFWRL